MPQTIVVLGDPTIPRNYKSEYSKRQSSTRLNGQLLIVINIPHWIENSSRSIDYQEVYKDRKILLIIQVWMIYLPERMNFEIKTYN